MAKKRAASAKAKQSGAAASTKKKSSSKNNGGRSNGANEASISSLLQNKKKQSLIVETLHPGAVFCARDFMSSSECQALVQFAETSGDMEQVAHPATKYVAQRECGRWQRNDPEAAKKLFERIISATILPQITAQLDFSNDYVPVACNSNLRLYKYEKGMSFGKHYDDSDRVEEGDTEITVLIYLSTCTGGATRFYPPHSSNHNQSFAFTPQQGAILLHIHGDRCLQHEADPVLEGVKYVLRMDVVYAKQP